MGRYTIRRILQMIPVIIGTTLLIFSWSGRCPATRSPAGAANGPARRHTSTR